MYVELYDKLLTTIRLNCVISPTGKLNVFQTARLRICVFGGEGGGGGMGGEGGGFRLNVTFSGRGKKLKIIIRNGR